MSSPPEWPTTPTSSRGTLHVAFEHSRRIDKQPYRKVEQLVDRGQDPLNIQTVVRCALKKNIRATMHIIHLLCRLDLVDYVPSLDDVERLCPPAKNNTDTYNMYKTTQYDAHVTAQYEHNIMASHLIRGDLSSIGDKSSIRNVGLACYGRGFDAIKSSLKTRINDNPVLVVAVIAHAANGGHYDVMSYVGDRIYTDEMFECILVNVFVQRHWGEADWETEQESVKAIEFLRSLGISYQSMSGYTACRPMMRDYLVTKGVDWYEALVPDWQSDSLVALIDSRLVKWERVKNRVTKVWYSGNRRKVLLNYLFAKGLETKRSLIYGIFETTSTNYCREYVETAVVTAKTMSEADMSKVIQLAVENGHIIMMENMVQQDIVTWDEITELAVTARVDAFTMDQISRSSNYARKSKRMKLGQDS